MRNHVSSATVKIFQDLICQFNGYDSLHCFSVVCTQAENGCVALHSGFWSLTLLLNFASSHRPLLRRCSAQGEASPSRPQGHRHCLHHRLCFVECRQAASCSRRPCPPPSRSSETEGTECAVVRCRINFDPTPKSHSKFACGVVLFAGGHGEKDFVKFIEEGKSPSSVAPTPKSSKTLRKRSKMT